MGNRYSRIDICKLMAALLIISIHTNPLMSYSQSANFIVTRIFGRLAVPFFFVCSGYLFFKNPSRRKLFSYIKKMALLYLLSIAIYLPINFYAGYFTTDVSATEVLKDIVFNGTFYHLWYLPALIMGMIICYPLSRHIKTAFVLTLILYVVGVMGDSYFAIVANNELLYRAYGHIFRVFNYTRNGLFFAPIFIIMGAHLTSVGNRAKSWWLVPFFALYCVEIVLLKLHNIPRHDAMTIFLLPTSYFLFKNILYLENKQPVIPFLRNIPLWIYIWHPFFIVAVRALSKLTGVSVLVENSLFHYICVTLFTFFFSCVIIKSSSLFNIDTRRLRAYAEINLSNATHNFNELKRILQNKKTLVMAVVKAEAYGHGSVKLSKHFNKIGIRHFAVAEIDEAIKLRKNGVKGDILILGFTPVCRKSDIFRYNLTQAIYSLDYAKQLSKSFPTIKAHVKVDTGMNRLGISFNDKEDILHIYKLERLKVKGIFSHLSRADSLDDTDTEFTRQQIKRFDGVLDFLKGKNIDIGLRHIQSTYGVLNYSDLNYDLVRCGLALFGVLSRDDAVRCDVSLAPILSLKSKVVTVKNVRTGETVGYDKTFTAKRDLKIAIVSIGYGDGYPRILINRGAHVLINGAKAPIIGNINMDSMIVDVTEIDDIKPETIVTLIGFDGNNKITASEISEKCDTINNELLCRIGSRVYRVFR